VVGGLAVAQQVRFRQGTIGALALFLNVKKATWREGGYSLRRHGQFSGGGLSVTQHVRFRQGRIGALALFLQVKKATWRGGGVVLTKKRQK
jgi:hypothetical protein